MKPWISSYHAFSNKPITNVDPNGDGDGWIEDKDGNVSWDSKTNSEADFKKNYTDKGKTGFKYASDKDDSKAYSLPSGEGKLIMDNWGPPIKYLAASRRGIKNNRTRIGTAPQAAGN